MKFRLQNPTNSVVITVMQRAMRPSHTGAMIMTVLAEDRFCFAPHVTVRETADFSAPTAFILCLSLSLAFWVALIVWMLA